MRVGVDGDGGVGRSVGLDLVRRKSAVYWRSFSRPSFILLSKSVEDRLFNQPLRELLRPPDQAGSCFVGMTRTHCCISEGLNWTEASLVSVCVLSVACECLFALLSFYSLKACDSNILQYWEHSSCFSFANWRQECALGAILTTIGIYSSCKCSTVRKCSCLWYQFYELKLYI